MINPKDIEKVIEQKAFAYLGSEPMEKCIVDHEMSEYLYRNVLQPKDRRDYYIMYCKKKKEMMK